MARPSGILVMTTILGALLSGCGGSPARPPAVPPEAAWSGEGKRGVFLKVGEHNGTLWHLDLWDRSGRPLGSGTFRLRGFAKAKIVPEEILGWENGALHLKDGTRLLPEAPAPK
jgi:hypothetical protein